MADYAPPTGPPPPKVPEGWKVIWNDQYKEWFYVNIYTKKSQWDKPDFPVYPPGDGTTADHAPPAYDPNAARPVQPEKTGGSTGEAMFNPGGAGSSAHQDTSADEALARRLQEEENARSGAGGPPCGATGTKGASDDYYNQGQPQQYGQQPNYGQPQQYGQPSPAPYNPNDLPPDPRVSSGKSKGGFLGKLLGKGKSSQPQQQYYPQQGGYRPQQGYYPQQHQGGYYPPQGQPGRRPGGGLGAGGAAALGVGGGLLGGVLLADALDGHDGGGDDGGYGGDGGGFGADDGGGDFGGDGGGDFGGGDF